MEHVVRLKMNGALSAKQACVLAFWSSCSGATGGIEKPALRPDAQTGKFSRKFDEVAGTAPNASSSYSPPLARRVRTDATR
eukprot:14265910-Alexandrium_andersonii.AAC.1